MERTQSYYSELSSLGATSEDLCTSWLDSIVVAFAAGFLSGVLFVVTVVGTRWATSACEKASTAPVYLV